jgi:hypothetical protein
MPYIQKHKEKKMTIKQGVKEKPKLSLLALISFVASFLIARTFTTLNPTIILVTGGYHIHHFWYGLALLAIGGWIGISYQSEKTDRLAAILFGAGGGLVGDEVGILLTFSAHAYWAEFSYTFVIVFLAIVSILTLISRYQKSIFEEFAHFSRKNTSLYFGIFLVAISTAFLLETTDNIILMTFFGVLVAIACLIILSYFFSNFKKEENDKKVIIIPIHFYAHRFKSFS